MAQASRITLCVNRDMAICDDTLPLLFLMALYEPAFSLLLLSGLSSLYFFATQMVNM